MVRIAQRAPELDELPPGGALPPVRLLRVRLRRARPRGRCDAGACFFYRFVLFACRQWGLAPFSAPHPAPPVWCALQERELPSRGVNMQALAHALQRLESSVQEKHCCCCGAALLAATGVGLLCLCASEVR